MTCTQDRYTIERSHYTQTFPHLLLHRQRSWCEAAAWYQRALDMDSAGLPLEHTHVHYRHTHVHYRHTHVHADTMSFHPKTLAMCLGVGLVVSIWLMFHSCGVSKRGQVMQSVLHQTICHRPSRVSLFVFVQTPCYSLACNVAVSPLKTQVTPLMCCLQSWATCT